MSTAASGGGTCALMTSGAASKGGVWRGRSFIGIVAPGCESLCHTLSGSSGGVSGSGPGAGEVPRAGAIWARRGRGADEVQTRYGLGRHRKRRFQMLS